MEPAQALGLWHSDFGAVKIEPDTTKSQDAVMGVWVYERNGQEVIGFFAGNLRGNVLEFSWHDPAEPSDLTGGGYVVFEPAGGRFSGQLWTLDRQRTYAWNGWRNAGANAGIPSEDSGAGATPGSGDQLGDPYGGNSYGGNVPDVSNPPEAAPPPPPPPPRPSSTPGNPYD